MIVKLPVYLPIYRDVETQDPQQPDHQVNLKDRFTRLLNLQPQHKEQVRLQTDHEICVEQCKQCIINFHIGVTEIGQEPYFDTSSQLIGSSKDEFRIVNPPTNIEQELTKKQYSYIQEVQGPMYQENVNLIQNQDQNLFETQLNQAFQVGDRFAMQNDISLDPTQVYYYWIQ